VTRRNIPIKRNTSAGIFLDGKLKIKKSRFKSGSPADVFCNVTI